MIRIQCRLRVILQSPMLPSKREDMPQELRRAAAAAVYFHVVIMIVHGVAHGRLHVELSVGAAVFVAAVIGIAPIVALVLIQSGRRRQGAAILAVSMTASLVFGVSNHFFLESADHVAHIADGPWKLPFQVTAWLLVGSEGAASMIALQLLSSQTSTALMFNKPAARTEVAKGGQPDA